jgi:hypothetical protein
MTTLIRFTIIAALLFAGVASIPVEAFSVTWTSLDATLFRFICIIGALYYMGMVAIYAE